MLKNIIVNVGNQKTNKMDEIVNFVHYEVRTSEFDGLLAKMSKYESLIKKAYLTKSESEIASLTDTELALVDGLEVSKYKSDKKDFETCKEELTNLAEKGITKETYDALTVLDKVCLKLQAHTTLSKITLDESVLKDLDISKPIQKWFRNNQGLSIIKKALSKSFNDLLLDEGVLFYGIKIRGGNISDETCKQFFSQFVKAGREGKDKDGKFAYLYDLSDKKVLIELTTLFAVVFESGECEVLKPETKKDSKTTDTKNQDANE